MAMTYDAINQLRIICLALPEATEGAGVGDPTFRVRDKIFAMQHPVNERPSMWCKAPHGVQEMLIGSAPETFFIPPYVGQHGWVGTWLDIEVDWAHVADLVEDSYRMTASKKQVRMLDAQIEMAKDHLS
jgi:predicted DNA-binding protein (MmcQ/YjbR family)